MIVLDASVLIAFLDPADRHHVAAVDIIVRGPEPFLVHELTLAEVLVAPARKRRDEAMLLDLHGIGVRAMSLGDGGALLVARVRARTGLKMPDACVVATALQLEARHDEPAGIGPHLADPERAGATVATFDARLAAAARSLGLHVM